MIGEALWGDETPNPWPVVSLEAVGGEQEELVQAGVEERGTPQVSGTTHRHQEGPPHHKTPLATPGSSPLQGGKERERVQC